MDAEARQWANEVAEVEAWWKSSPRYKFTERPYSAEEVVKLRGTMYKHFTPASNYTAKKLYALLRARFDSKKYTHTFGCLDPVQVVQMNKYLETVYVSGWQCSSTASTTNEPGPDFADYPANTVPNKVDQLFKAQNFHDRKQREARSRMTAAERAKKPAVDYLRPIIADGDTGFGGMTSVMKLVKLQIDAGAAGIHIEDQKPGAKKCGHLGGKVLVPVREQCDRLCAARLQSDICGTETVVISRTDADSATFLENNIDYRDHPYIAGATVDMPTSLDDAAPGPEQDNWLENAKLMRYTDAVAAAMKAKGRADLVGKWVEQSMTLSHPAAKKLATSLGFGDVFWCWNTPRSREGYFRIIGGVDYCVMRAKAFSPLADCIWMETAKPNLQEAAEFSNGVHATRPHQMLAYNLSPSFNWDASGMTDDEMMRFQGDIGRLGFVWQFITLAGFHANALSIDQFAKAYASPKGVLAYVQMIQRQEREQGVETLTHQRWSGTEVCDKMLRVATGGGASTDATANATENQFMSKI